MHHLLAYRATMTAGSTNENVAALADGIVTITNGHFLFDRDMKIWAAYVQGATLTDARINTPAMRVIALPRIQPLQIATTPGDLFPLADWRRNPLTTKRADEIAIETSNGAGAGEIHTALLFVSDGLPNEPRGEVYTIKATGTTTLTAGVWTSVQPTFEQTLPGGNYEIIGMRAIGTTAIAARIVLPGGGWKPGCVAVASQAMDDRSMFRMGAFGSYGNFASYAPPLFEFLANAADTAQTVYLDVVRKSAA